MLDTLIKLSLRPPFLPLTAVQRCAFAECRVVIDWYRYAALAAAAMTVIYVCWLFIMQSEVLSQSARSQGTATARSLDSTAPKTRSKHHGRDKTPETITVSVAGWNALLKRVSDIEQWLDRNAQAMPVGIPRAEWEAAQAKSMLDAAEAADKLSLSNPNQARKRVKEGKLFAVIAPGRERGMMFPAWQFHRAVVGEPLQQILTALQVLDLEGWAIHEFFEEPRVTLNGLSARETLIGTADSEGHAPSAYALLSSASQERLARVLTAIEEYSHEP